MLMGKGRQRGFTISELLVGMVVGLLVMGAVIGVYVTVLNSSSTVLRGSRLNQEMSAIMSIMANDIRRAGYWGTAAFEVVTDNPFSQVFVAAADRPNTSALRVHNNDAGSYTDVTYDDVTTGQGVVTAASSGSCITYTYDDLDTDGNGTVTAGETGDGILEDDEKFGFRWNGAATDALEMRTSTNGGANACTGGTWGPVTDPAEIVIKELTFDISASTCINAAEPDEVEDGGDAAVVDDPLEYDCYTTAPDSGETTAESRQVVMTLSAQLADDPAVNSTLVQTVEVRNHLVWVRP
jgi:type IV pilus assembly protein PilW